MKNKSNTTVVEDLVVEIIWWLTPKSKRTKW